MHPIWDISDEDIEKWRSFVEDNLKNNFVVDRRKNNITRKNVDLSTDMLWHVHIGCQVTTQQRSGPESKVSKFLKNSVDKLGYKECAESSNREKLIQKVLSSDEIWRSKVIAKNLASIMTYLEDDGWTELASQLETITKNTTKKKERVVADYLRDTFAGIGLKQSRNYIQWLGLSRYEIPLDSRITRTMRRLGCRFVPKAVALGDEATYLFVQDGLQQIAERLEVYPCILDACIFSSFDVEKT